LNNADRIRCLLRWTLCCYLLLAVQVQAEVEARAETKVDSGPKTILVLGDSISAAYGMSLSEGWVALLAEQLRDSYPAYQIVNASISGETSGGAVSRIAPLLAEHRPAVVIIELGGNDGLRGYPIKRFRSNMQQMIEQSQAIDAAVLLLGMQIPPNYGARYTEQFRDSYGRLADEMSVALAPFLLEGIATDASLMQEDGIHPSIEAQSLLLNTVWLVLQPLLEQ
jgi:acyl-CoA thioesterase-1